MSTNLIFICTFKKYSVKTRYLSFIFLITTLLLSGYSCSILRKSSEDAKKSPSSDEKVIEYDDTRKTGWSADFGIADIVSSKDGKIQKAYYYKATSVSKRPLIVSLHTWSGDYTQKDTLSILCKLNDINYIHPDFRGPNRTKEACCSELALADMDDAIDYAIKHLNPDVSRIYVIGASGGGYATLSMFMKSKHKIKKFSSWVPISDLETWYHESLERKAAYAQHILQCTGSEGNVLNVKAARDRSPMFWPTPLKKLNNSSLHIYAGVYDGIQGSVPITHSLNFYNKILSDLQVEDKSKYVSPEEEAFLLEHRKPLADFGRIADRDICLLKEYRNLKLVIFDGKHEMLPVYAFNSLIED